MPSEALRPTASAKEENMKAIYLEEAIERFSESGSSLSKDQIIYMLNRMPYTEIVRCRDCRRKYVKDMSAYCPHRVGAINAWDFCSFGERSEE